MWPTALISQFNSSSKSPNTVTCWCTLWKEVGESRQWSFCRNHWAEMWPYKDGARGSRDFSAESCDFQLQRRSHTHTHTHATSLLKLLHVSVKSFSLISGHEKLNLNYTLSLFISSTVTLQVHSAPDNVFFLLNDRIYNVVITDPHLNLDPVRTWTLKPGLNPQTDLWSCKDHKHHVVLAHGSSWSMQTNKVMKSHTDTHACSVWGQWSCDELADDNIEQENPTSHLPLTVNGLQ